MTEAHIAAAQASRVLFLLDPDVLSNCTWTWWSCRSRPSAVNVSNTIINNSTVVEPPLNTSAWDTVKKTP